MLCNIVSAYNVDTPSPTLTSQRNMIRSTTEATDRFKQTEVAALCMQQRVFPVPSSSSPIPSPSSANQQETSFHVNLFHHASFETNSFEPFDDRLASDTNQPTNKPLHKPDQKFDSIEDKCHISPSTNQSRTSSFCNATLSQLNGIAHGSTGANNSNVDQVATVQKERTMTIFRVLLEIHHRSIPERRL
ncbi:hypothetical protein V6N11_024217 [Hibiscus sabdariffa]|uniref:Uncharacterized protein n=2 Tax=Hibiscus sabdariffa TaxID=183260 RepID=A0ABR1ZLU7_9ROSI